MSPRAWIDFLTISTLSALVAIYGTPEVGAPALIIAGIGAATALFGAITDHRNGR